VAAGATAAPGERSDAFLRGREIAGDLILPDVENHDFVRRHAKLPFT